MASQAKASQDIDEDAAAPMLQETHDQAGVAPDIQPHIFGFLALEEIRDLANAHRQRRIIFG